MFKACVFAVEQGLGKVCKSLLSCTESFLQPFSSVQKPFFEQGFPFFIQAFIPAPGRLFSSVSVKFYTQYTGLITKKTI